MHTPLSIHTDKSKLFSHPLTPCIDLRNRKLIVSQMRKFVKPFSESGFANYNSCNADIMQIMLIP